MELDELERELAVVAYAPTPKSDVVAIVVAPPAPPQSIAPPSTREATLANHPAFRNFSSLLTKCSPRSSAAIGATEIGAATPDKTVLEIPVQHKAPQLLDAGRLAELLS